MRVCEATRERIRELCAERKMTEYMLIYNAGMPPSTVKSIISGRSKNPGILNIKRITEGLGVSLREFYDSDMFEDLEQED
ncbi:MAG TPA: helix-turn-helix transcriptional regulator [Candidatus Lachnoclostridium stercorigallinarum]|uniref:Helix-turn-helix transcriptional regulator n=1 Tax=Candidatus Lachnoclostridium stercorigallinarum TaxID=2838634 RepID=A0A9D2GHB5_9FIRM|nr:helix-turn-helix transcriptional regulator [Candidatus Lachnoclostridium stercorigallinarum]